MKGLLIDEIGWGYLPFWTDKQTIVLFPYVLNEYLYFNEDP